MLLRMDVKSAWASGANDAVDEDRQAPGAISNELSSGQRESPRCTCRPARASQGVRPVNRAPLLTFFGVELRKSAADAAGEVLTCLHLRPFDGLRYLLRGLWR